MANIFAVLLGNYTVKKFDAAGKIDKVLLVSVLTLVCIGLLFVYSASMYTAEISYGNKYFFLFKQLTGAAVGLVAMFAVSRVNTDFLKKFWIAGVIVSAVLLGCVFIPGLGIENYGAKRWIGFGSFSFQPSEIAKFAFVLFCAVYMSKKDMAKFSNSLAVVGVGVLFCGLIIAEPNMSITMCVAMLMVIMLFLGGMKWKNFLFLLAPIVLAVPVLIFAEPYRLQRLLAFLDPWASPKDEGYQLIQSLYALGSGGFFGVGLFNSRQKYRFLPFAESDFIFSVIGDCVCPVCRSGCAWRTHCGKQQGQIPLLPCRRHFRRHCRTNLAQFCRGYRKHSPYGIAVAVHQLRRNVACCVYVGGRGVA